MDITQLNTITNKILSDINQSNKRVGSAIGKISTGNGQLTASDSITNISVSTRLAADVESLHKATTNANSAGSLLQTAGGGLQSIIGLLERMEALAIQASSGAYSLSDRLHLDREFQVLKQDIDRVAEGTRFNDIQVLIKPEQPIATDITLNGTINPDNLVGGAGNDTIIGLDGDDIIAAGVGNDIINPGTLRTPGLQGSIYRSGPFGGIANLAEAEAIVASEPLFAQFVSTSLDYPNGAVNNQNSNLNNFLGADAASLDNPVGGFTANRMVFVFEGFIDAPADGNYNFRVGSDDGFNLQIDGATVTQFPNNRGFGFTNGNVFLTEGEHSFRLLFWENGGSEGLEADSNINGIPNEILDTTNLTFAGSADDGDDTIDGEDGTDIVVFDGNQADYTVNIIAPGQAQIIDNRPGTPNGTDNVVNVEILRFADTDLVIGDFIPPPPPPDVLRWQVHEDAREEMIEYEIVDARAVNLFDEDPVPLNIQNETEAKQAADAVNAAIGNVLEHMTYVGTIQRRANITGDALVSRIAGLDSGRGQLGDADIAEVSSELASAEVQRQSGISVLAQSNRLNADNVQTLTEDVLVFGERPLANGSFVNMRTIYDI